MDFANHDGEPSVEGFKPDRAEMNLAAACQVITAVTLNISCMIGMDKAFEALDFVRGHREIFEKMSEEMRGFGL